jgi:hypothetical protein
MSGVQIALAVVLFALTPFIAGALILSVLALSDTDAFIEIDDSEED